MAPSRIRAAGQRGDRLGQARTRTTSPEDGWTNGPASPLLTTGCWLFAERDPMPKLTVENVGTFDVPAGKRLVLALEDEARVDQLHACGGNARCTTCRVEFLAGEPNQMTVAEKQVLAARGVSGVRLSCQILCDHDMTVRAISRLAGSGRKDAGSRPL